MQMWNRMVWSWVGAMQSLLLCLVMVYFYKTSIISSHKAGDYNSCN